MKDITSLEKSKALKAAGVLPPHVEVGQVWYEPDNGEPFIILFIPVEDIKSGMAYAFTPSDLLPLLPPDTIVQMWGGKPSVTFLTHKDGVFLEVRIEGENLADIMADALLQTLSA